MDGIIRQMNSGRFLVSLDDTIIRCRRQDEVNKMRNCFSELLKMNDTGALFWFLRTQFKQSPGTVIVTSTTA